MLELLPQRGLDQSILLPVLVGLFVLAALTETYGWVFVGLVVPGYLGSVFVIQPGAGLAMVVEALITFGLVASLSSWLSKTGAWSAFFGRDRFFLIVLISVFVRQNTQLWLFPSASAWLSSSFGIAFALQYELMSIGLVLVPLTANMMWKLGLSRGLVQLAVPTAITAVITGLLLVPFTNLSLSNLELTYESVAIDFQSSAKAYIILLVGAALASRFNLRYGWDFGGILVPSLLALTWLSPIKLVQTAVEAVIVAYLARVLLMLPPLRTANVEGPRPILLVFTTGFALKVVAVWALGDNLPALKVTELFGFGYLLPSLLALRMIKARSVPKVLLPTVFTSGLAFALGSLVGFGLEYALPRAEPPAPTMIGAEPPVLAQTGPSAAVLARSAVVAEPSLTDPQGWGWQERRNFIALWQGIAQWTARPTDEVPETVLSASRGLGIDVRALDRVQNDPRTTFVLRESVKTYEGLRGYGTALLRPGAAGPVLSVPWPRRDGALVFAAYDLCRRCDCKAVVLRGHEAYWGTTVAAEDDPPCPEFERLRSGLVLELRSLRDDGPVRVHVRDRWPEQAHVAELWPADDTQVLWTPAEGTVWPATPAAATLDLPTRALKDLVASTVAAPEPLSQTAIHFVRQQLAARPVLGADDDTARGRGPSAVELDTLEHVAALVLTASKTGHPDAARWASAAADRAGFVLETLQSCEGLGTVCWALRHPVVDWGTLIVRVGPAEAVAVQTPSPRAEIGVLALSRELWSVMQGRAWVVGGRSPHRLRSR